MVAKDTRFVARDARLVAKNARYVAKDARFVARDARLVARNARDVARDASQAADAEMGVEYKPTGEKTIERSAGYVHGQHKAASPEINRGQKVNTSPNFTK